MMRIASTWSSPDLFETGEIVIVNEGLEMPELPHSYYGEVVDGSPSARDGSISVQFAKLTMTMDGLGAGYLTTVQVQPDKLRKLPAKDDPRFCYVRRRRQDTGSKNGPEQVDVVRVENGAGKSCVVCASDLGKTSYLKVAKESGAVAYYCEEDYVANFHQQEGAAARYCHICHDFVSIRDDTCAWSTEISAQEL